MAQRTDADLLIEANVIRDETAVGANTALRVGVMLDNLIDSKVNNDNVSNNTGLGGSTPSPTVVPSQNAVKTYVDTLVVGYLNDRGNYDPTITSLYPTTGGSGAGGVIEKGDLFFISADGTMNTIPVLTGYTVRALASAPGQTDGNWSISNVGIGYIPENSASRSTDPTMGSPTPSNVLYPSQLAVRDFVDTQILAAVPYTAENVANKVPSDITLDPTSTVLYPSNAAVVNFVTANTGLPYQVYTAILNYNGGSPIANVLQNTLGVSINWTNPFNGILYGTAASGNPFTSAKTWLIGGSYDNSGQPYFTICETISTNIVDVTLYLYDGTRTGTPNFQNLQVEIRVYP
jgi:hypothetical protein